MDAAEAMAQRVMASSPTLNERIQYAFELALARPATKSELADAQAYFSSMRMHAVKQWTIYCQVLLCSNEFMYLQ